MRRPLLSRHAGGKATIAPWIVAHLPPHRRYVEGFAGAANVLFAKDRTETEVLIERNPDQVALLRAVRDDYPTLSRLLLPLRWRRETWQEASDRLKAGDWSSQTERAALRLTLLKMGFGGCGGYSHSSVRYQQGWWERGILDLWKVGRRLQGVRIVQGDCLAHLYDHDSPETCFYLDPPYVGVGCKIYGRYGMSDVEHEELCRRIRRLRGKVVLSGYANPIYDRYLGDWEMVNHPVKLTAPLARHKRADRVESLWINNF